MVERFMREFFEMKPNENGLWVNYSDYAALEAKLAETKGKLNEIACWSQSQGLLWWQVKAREGITALEPTPPAPKVTEEMVERALDVMRSATYAAIKSEEGNGLDIQKLNFIGMSAALTAVMEADQ